MRKAKRRKPQEAPLLFADLVEALALPSRVPLRRQLDRGGFTLPHADCRTGSGKWIKFSMADLATLALIRALVTLGVPMANASELVQDLIEKGKVEIDDVDAFLERWASGDAYLVMKSDGRPWASMLLAGPWRTFFRFSAGILLVPHDIVEPVIQRARAALARRAEAKAA